MPNMMERAGLMNQELCRKLLYCIYRVKFPYTHVWNALNDESKWKDECKKKKNDSKRAKVSEEGTHTLSGANLDDDEEEVREVRSMGKKASKKLEAEKRKGKSIMSNDHSKTISQIHLIEEGRQSVTDRLAKTKIICAATYKMMPMQKELYSMKMKEIAAKYG